jgi:hypothetical protein
MLGRPPFTAYESESSGWLLFPPGQARPEVEVVIAAAMRVMSEADPADVAALLRVDRIIQGGNAHEVCHIFAEVYRSIPIGSAQQANTFAEIRAGLTNGLQNAMSQAISILSNKEFVDNGG